MKSITIFSNLAPLYISLRDGGGGTNNLVFKTKAYNYKLENYKHTSIKGGII